MQTRRGALPVSLSVSLSSVCGLVVGRQAKINALETQRQVGFAEGVALRRLRDEKSDLAYLRQSLTDQVGPALPQPPFPPCDPW